MKRAKKQFGQKGEDWAVAFLIRQGYTIIETNWHCDRGELDIVACQGHTLVFVEVRSRHAPTTEAALASIDNHKRRKLLETAQVYLADHGLEDTPWRIDLIAIAVPRSGNPIIEQVEDALDW